MSLKLICYLMLVFPGILGAQSNSYISGVVVNDKRENLAGITILVSEAGKGTMTNTAGKFEIVLKPGSYTLIISGIGYKSQSQKIILQPRENLALTFILEEHTTTLNELEILGKSEAQIQKEQSIKAEVIDLKSVQIEATTLAESMNRAAGIRIRQTGGLGSQASVFVNGFTGKAVKFFRDDIPLDYLGEGFNLTMLPINMLDRVDVYKGAMPVKLGADALGSAINYATKSNVKNYIDASYEVASFNTHRASLNLYQSKNKFFYGLDGFFNHSDNSYKVTVKITDPETTKPSLKDITRFHDDFTNAFGEAYFGIRNTTWADELRITFSSFYTNSEVQNDPNMRDPYGEIITKQNGFIPTLRYKKSALNSKLTIDQFLVYARLKNKVIDTCSCTYDWFGNRSKPIAVRDGEQDSDGSLSTINYSNFTSRTYFTYQLSENIKLEFNNVISGFSRLGADPFGTVYFYSKRDILSVPASYTKWVTSLGGEASFFERKLINNIAVKRYAYKTSGTDGAFTSYSENATVNRTEAYGFSEALKFTVNNNSFLRGSIEWAYRLPEQGEVFGDGMFMLSNFTLKPERSTNINIGYRYEKLKKFSIEPNFFYRITKDQIILVPENLIFLQYQNVEQVKGYGLDLDFNYFPAKWLQFFGNVTYQEFRLFGLTGTYRYLEDARLRNTPYFFTNIGVRTEFKNKLMLNDAIRAFWYFSHTHEFYLTPIKRSQEPSNLWSRAKIDDDFIIDNQNLHSAGVNYSINNHKLSFGLEVKNIFNDKLFDNFKVQKAGRSFHLKLRYIIN